MTPRFHLAYQVDHELYLEREAFITRTPEQVAIFLRVHHGMPLVACHTQYAEEADSCYFLTNDGRPARRAMILKAQLRISRQIGVICAEFVSSSAYVPNPNLKETDWPSPYYDPDLKRIHQYDFTARCIRNDRCIRPSHLVLFRKGVPYEL